MRKLFWVDVARGIVYWNSPSLAAEHILDHPIQNNGVPYRVLVSAESVQHALKIARDTRNRTIEFDRQEKSLYIIHRELNK